MNDSAESRPLTFGELGVPGPLVRVLAADDKKTAFPIQADTLPDSLAGRDILGRGRTGSGKTLAFSIPLITRLGSYDSFGEIAMEEFRKEIKRRKKASLEERRADDFLPHPRGLVLAPTRELANQINDVLMPLAHTFGMNTTTVYGGVKYIHQIRDLKAGADIVVACPGRLEDLLRQQALTLSSVEVVVIDEADEMADMGFLPPVKRLLEQISPDAQHMLFSATLDHGVDEVVNTFLHDPKVHEVDSATTEPDLMTHHVFETTRGDKHELVRMLASGEGRRILFTRTKFQAKKLAKNLTQNGIPAAELHGNLNQNQRDRNLAAFDSGDVRVMVATDVAARGIDVGNLTHVINYSLPQDSESYVHRIGRTGRAGKQGTAITFVSPSEFRGLNNLMRDIKVEIKRETLPSPQDIVEMKRLKIKDEMQEIVENESYDGYREFAEELLAEYTPDVALGALLRLAFRSELDQSNYPEIRSFSVDRKGTARLFLAVGRRDGYTARKLVDMLKFKCGLRDKYINDVQISDNFSFVSVPFHDAEEIVRKLNRLNRGRRPIAEIARDGEEAAARKPRRAKTADAGGEEYAPAPKKSVRREKPAAPAQTAPAAGDESAAPRRKLKTKIQTEPRPEIPDFSKMSNEGFDWSAFMKFDDGTAWGRDENGKGKGAKSVRKTPKRTVTAAQRIAAKGKKRK